MLTPHLKCCELCSGNGLIEVFAINGARIAGAEHLDRHLTKNEAMPPIGDKKLRRSEVPPKTTFVRCPCSAGERFKQFQPFDAKRMEPAAGAAFRKQKADAE